MTQEFKPKFNFLVPIFRLIYCVFLLGITVMFAYHLVLSIMDTERNPIEIGAFLLGLMLFYSYSHVITKSFFLQTKKIAVTKDFLKEINFLRNTSRLITKEDIIGFSTSVIPYKIGSFSQIIVYLKNNEKIELLQFCYFNFKEIEPILLNCGYKHLGFEIYRWKWFDSRHYKYETASSPNNQN